jgi:hypothetical protein
MGPKERHGDPLVERQVFGGCVESVSAGYPWPQRYPSGFPASGRGWASGVIHASYALLGP